MEAQKPLVNNRMESELWGRFIERGICRSTKKLIILVLGLYQIGAGLSYRKLYGGLSTHGNVYQITFYATAGRRCCIFRVPVF